MASSSTRSIMTLDGYVSRSQAPNSSVLRDHAMLQDFAAYLELRLKSQNLSMLRRIFADFLNEHESTLIPMMQQGCTIITIFPVERTSVRRRQQAELLLSKPKCHLDSRGCVFLYLQYRTATRNMALLKHLFLEFVGQRETTLLAFVERGCQVISVIPFELPQITVPTCPLPPQLKQGVSPREVETVMRQEQDTLGEVSVVANTKKKNVAVKIISQRQLSTAEADVAEQQSAKDEKRIPHSDVISIGQHTVAVDNGREIVTSRRQKRILPVATAGSTCSGANEGTSVPPTSNCAAVLTQECGRRAKLGAVPQEHPLTAVVEQDEGNVPTGASAPQRLPASLSNEASSTEAPENILMHRIEHASVAFTNGSADSKANEAVSVPWISTNPTAISVPQCGKWLASDAVPPQRKPTAVVEQGKRNAPIEPSTSESLSTGALPNKAWLTEALGNVTRCQSEQAGVTSVASTSEAASNKVRQDKNAPVLTAGSILDCSKQPNDIAVLPRQDLVAADQVDVMPNEVVPALAGDLAIGTLTADVTSELEIRMKRRLECVDAGRSGADREIKATSVSNSIAVLTPKQCRKSTASVDPPQQSSAAGAREQIEVSSIEAPPSEAPQTEAPIEIIASKTLPIKASPAEASQTEVPTKVLLGSQHQPKRERDNVDGEKRSRKRGKPFMTEEMCRSQIELTRRMGVFEAQSPWKVPLGNLPVPFDAERYPELARKFYRFWRKHLRAVWERNFWAPMSRKLCLPAFNKRNNRQLTAKNAFESLIVSVYEKLGAAFFVKIDMQKERYPGWWYRGPVVALFSLQQIKGENAMWDYVRNEAFKRFPDCNLPIPLTAAYSGAMRSKHKGESESMWMVNHQLTARILREIAALKAEKQAYEQAEASQVTTMERDRDMKNSIALVEALELM